jgi:predicted DNA-binding transcriptional regulator YafY
MPQVKNALIRYRIIDRALRNTKAPFPSKVKLRELCEESLFGSVNSYNICDSTIEKDLFAMRTEYDAPLKYSTKNRGYYYADSNFTIDDTPLTTDDVAALKFAASTIAQFRNTDFFKEYGFALDRIIDRIGTQDSTNSTANLIQFETGHGETGQEYINTLLTAIENKKQIWFDYTNYTTGEKKRRKATPLLLKEYRNRWYLISYDLIKDRISTFGLDRMEEIEISDEKANMPVNFNPDLYFKHSVGITVTSEQPVQIVFIANNLAAKYLISQAIHPSQKVLKEDEKQTTLELNVLITEELIRNLLSYGSDIEVIEPTILRNELRERIERMYEKYINPNS